MMKLLLKFTLANRYEPLEICNEIFEYIRFRRSHNPSICRWEVKQVNEYTPYTLFRYGILDEPDGLNDYGYIRFRIENRIIFAEIHPDPQNEEYRQQYCRGTSIKLPRMMPPPMERIRLERIFIDFIKFLYSRFSSKIIRFEIVPKITIHSYCDC